ncbi:hypothetical protein UlMin_019440 [Ulmus minor]
MSSDTNPKAASYPSATATYDQVAQSSHLFLEKLQDFHTSFGTKFLVPIVGGKPLDLHCLFVQVTNRGGLEKVITDRKLKEVTVVFDFPTTLISASFVLRKYYQTLLYHFEQVYYFRKQVPSSSLFDSLGQNHNNGSENTVGTAITDHLPANMELQLGGSLTGVIDAKFDDGYVITVNLGSDQLKGVLYHVPLQMSQGSSSELSNRRNRKRSRFGLRDPDRPKSNRSGYNFFFAEHYARLKPMYHGIEKDISKRIGVLWNDLTEAEKQVYQDKGVMDKERYKNEMLQYKSSTTTNL